MKRRSLLVGLVLFTFSFSLFALDSTRATPRKDLLSEFCVNNKVNGGSFKDTNNGSSAEVSGFTTYSNIYILALIDPDLEMLGTDIDFTKQWILDEFNQFINFDYGNFPELTYSYMTAILVNASIEDTLSDTIDKVYEYQDETTNGFLGKNALEANVVDTAFAIEFLNMTTDGAYLPIVDSASVVDFIMSCYDSTTHGFKGSLNGEVSIADTYYALKTLSYLGSIDEVADDITDISAYLESFYIDDVQNTNHFGGYSIDSEYEISSIAATYYSIGILDFLGEEFHEETLNWVISRQNSNDYGFADINGESSVLTSSAKLSYYAVSTIQILDDGAFSDKRSAVMNEDVWNLKSNGWVIAAIWLGSIGLLTILGILIYKYKNRI